MAPPAALAGGGRGGAAAGQQRHQKGGIGQTITGIIRIAVFWYFASKFFAPTRPSDPSVLISNLFQKGDSLVVDDSEVNSKDDGLVEWVSYWKPNVTINVVDDFTRYPYNVVPPNIAPYLNVEPSTGNYYPTIFFNEFWLLRDKLIPINETVTELPLILELRPYKYDKMATIPTD